MRNSRRERTASPKVRNDRHARARHRGRARRRRQGKRAVRGGRRRTRAAGSNSANVGPAERLIEGKNSNAARESDAPAATREVRSRARSLERLCTQNVAATGRHVHRHRPAVRARDAAARPVRRARANLPGSAASALARDAKEQKFRDPATADAAIASLIGKAMSDVMPRGRGGARRGGGARPSVRQHHVLVWGAPPRAKGAWRRRGEEAAPGHAARARSLGKGARTRAMADTLGAPA